MIRTVIYVDGSTRRELRFADVRDQAKAFGVGLKSFWGWRKGDVLAIFRYVLSPGARVQLLTSISPNNIDTPPLILGVLWASGTVTFANPTFTADELALQLKDSGAKAIATNADMLPTARQTAANAGIPTDRIILLGDKRVPGHKHWKDIHDPSQALRWHRYKIDVERDVAFLVYSSGTTGRPKGVMLSHKNVGSNLCMRLATEGKNLDWRTSRILAFLPFFHIFGLTSGALDPLWAEV